MIMMTKTLKKERKIKKTIKNTQNKLKSYWKYDIF